MAEDRTDDTVNRRPREAGDGSPARTGGNGRPPARARPRQGRPPGSAAAAARSAASQVAELTGHRPESVVSLEPCDGGWKVGVEVVETERIPDTATILAVYDVVIDGDGELSAYHRTSRYARGQLREGR